MYYNSTVGSRVIIQSLPYLYYKTKREEGHDDDDDRVVDGCGAK